MTNVSQIFNAIWEGRGTVIRKRNRVEIFCRLNTMHECDRQTDKPTDHGTVASIAIGGIGGIAYDLAMSP